MARNAGRVGDGVPGRVFGQQERGGNYLLSELKNRLASERFRQMMIFPGIFS